MQVEDDSLVYDENGEVLETGYLDEETGEMKRPWCPATRILDHIENVRDACFYARGSQILCLCPEVKEYTQHLLSS